jgi:ribosomal silencing factor RsfS
LTGGLKGVFDVEQIVDLLHSEGAIDTFVCEIPKELCYADHIVIVTGRSVRHRLALAQLVRKVFKKKMRKTDMVPRIEGDGTANQADWLAMDLGT